MTFLKLQGLLVLTALLSFMCPTETRVVNSMTACPQFFLQNTPPNIPGILMNGNILNQNRYKPICQTFNNIETFVTLYDITNKIPVFSAYKYIGDDGGDRPIVTWMIEPQLDFPGGNNNNNMENRGRRTFTNQAVPRDYDNTQHFDKGHLLPNTFGFDDTVRTSTFTLTNAVPQKARFNRVRWRTMEGRVKGLLNNCRNNNNQIEGFVVIGAQPGTNSLNNINIPSLLWSAFCCYSSTQGTWLAGAHWGDNVNNIPVSPDMYDFRTLGGLYNKIGGGFDVFPNTPCPLI